jgi:hypothetical protein
MGIVGLPNVGKSTLFKILTNQDIVVANYPFATIDPNVGIVPVPDERLEKLAKLSNSKKVIPAVVEFYDIAGLVKGANKGEGLGNQFLSHIKEVNAIVEVIRCFSSDEIIHVENGVDPLRDLEIINTELILKDLDIVEKRIAKLEGEARSGDKNKTSDLDLAKKIKDGLNENKLASEILKGVELNVSQTLLVNEMNLLTAKPQIYLLNGSEADVSEDLKNKIKSLNADYLIMNLVDSTSSPQANKISELIKKAYEILGLISFLTTGEDETRAWTIKKGDKAPQAAGAIHSDFEKKFIRAETIGWQKLLEAGTFAIAKQQGWLRIEGKEYVVQDGDVMNFRHG